MRKIGKKVVISMLVGTLTVGSFSMTTLAAGKNHGSAHQTAICDGTGSGNKTGICDGTGSGNGAAKVKTPRRAATCRR